MDKLLEHLNSNEYIINDAELELKKLFKNNKEQIRGIRENLSYLDYNYTEIENFNNNELIQCVDKNLNQIKFDNMSKFNYLITLENSEGDKKVTELLSELGKTHKTIVNEFTGKYFTPKWYQWRKKKKYRNN